tara:strand:- start:296 stop:1258 length:963 start_codon:yes stop_codon:yes gene_type:complete
MKIKVYVVTWKNDEEVKRNIESLLNSDLINHDYQISIINNHSDFNLSFDNPCIRVVHNSVRPDFSTGHLARDWNFAIIDGFKDLNNPDCDIVVACQNDTLFFDDWVSNILEYHKKYDFIQFGIGDNYMSWTPDGVKGIGLFDENYCTGGFHVHDYFHTAVLLYGDKVSINDALYHTGHWNCVLDTSPERIFSKKSYKCNCSEIGKISVNDPQGYDKSTAINKVIDIEYSVSSENKLLLVSNVLYNWTKLFAKQYLLKKWNQNFDWFHSYRGSDEYKIKFHERGVILYPYFEKDISWQVLDKRNYLPKIIDEIVNYQVSSL